MWYISILLAVTAVLYFWCKYHYSYWKRQNLPCVTPIPIFGNLGRLISFKVTFGEHLKNIYNQHHKENAVGIYLFHKPGLVIRNLDLVKNILVKDFNKFSNRYVCADPHSDAIGAYNLFLVKSPLWKEIRTKVTPVFTSGKIKQMYPLMLEVGSDLESYLGNLPFHTNSQSYVTEIRDICALFTTDMIATIAFGLKANSLKNPESEFRKCGKKTTTFTFSRAFEIMIIFFLPQLTKIFRPKLFSGESSNFMRDTIRYTIQEREKECKGRGDLIDTLVALKQEAAADPLNNHFAQNLDFLVAQAAVFLTAGFETTSTTINFALYELAKYDHMQVRLRHEIMEALISGNGSISYEKIQEMEYLNMVVNETLRLYPALHFIERECSLTKDEMDNGFSMKPYFNYNISDGTPVYIPVLAIHRDSAYWPNPEVFDPERFSAENKKSHIPYAYLPFGTGPRNCIGNRIALLQSKLGLVHFLKNHYVAPCDKTMLTMKFDPMAINLQPLGGNYLKIIKDDMFLRKWQTK